MTNDNHQLCSIMNCPRHATQAESGKLAHWEVTIHYCGEHAREIENGTPVGATGVDPAKVEVRTLGTVKLRSGGPLSGIGPA